MNVVALVTNARTAADALAGSSSDARNAALLSIKESLSLRSESIFRANKEDLSVTELENELRQRLYFDTQKLQQCLAGIQRLVELPDPLNVCTLATELAEELELFRVTCPIGLIAVVFEARPEAAIQIASLGIKSGNGVILKGGKEALHTNREIYSAIAMGLSNLDPTTGVTPSCIQLIETRMDVKKLLEQHDLIDLVIPRGSRQLVSFVKENTRIPVLGHADGVCAVFIDSNCDLNLAVSVVVDSKMSYPAACNACETLLVHRQVADKFLPKLAEALSLYNVNYFADAACQMHLPADCVQPATTTDFTREFLGPQLLVISVENITEAVGHINKYGSHHTDVIVSSDESNVNYFMNYVHSAGVFHNVSSRYSDGYRYGFGAEVGISTGKIHSRGPVGLNGLTIYKYRLYGNGHIVGPPLSRPLTHKQLPLNTTPSIIYSDSYQKEINNIINNN